MNMTQQEKDREHTRRMIKKGREAALIEARITA
jgi:hypothetical protein